MKQKLKALNELSIDTENNITGVNSGGCGVFAYHVAKHFGFQEIIAIQGITQEPSEFLENINDNSVFAAGHYMIKIKDDLFFDSGGFISKEDLIKDKKSLYDYKVKFLHENELTLDFLHKLRYEDDDNYIFIVSITDFSSLKKAIDRNDIWNHAFNRSQIPDLKRLIKKRSKQITANANTFDIAFATPPLPPLSKKIENFYKGILKSIQQIVNNYILIN